MRKTPHIICRIAALILMLCLLPLASFAADDAVAALDDVVASLALINQTDGRYSPRRYYFCNAPLKNRGCGPCSVTNLMITALNVTDRNTADELLLDMMHLLTGNHRSSTHNMSIKYIKNLAEINAETQPVLADLIQERGLTVTYEAKANDLAYYQQATADAIANGTPLLALNRLPIQKKWSTVISLCMWLQESGCGNAYVMATYITGGTERSNGPLRAASGHYFTLLIQPDAYLLDGSFYLLDSQPQALADEPVRNSTYWSRYAFTKGYGTEKIFRKTYDAIRLNPTAVRFTLTQDALAALEGLDEGALLKARTEHLKQLKLFGEAVVAVYLPDKSIVR